MSDSVKPIHSKTAPAAGQFGLAPISERVRPKADRLSGCPSLEQFEARFLFANDQPVTAA